MTTHSSGLIQRLTLITLVCIGVATPTRALGVAVHQGILGVALALGLALLVFSVTARHRFVMALKSPLGLACLALFAAWAITAVFSFDPVGSFKMGGRTALLVLASAVLWAVFADADESAQRRGLKALVVSALVLTGLSLLALLDVPYVSEIMGGEFIERRRIELQFKAFAAAAMCMIPVVLWAGERLGGRWLWAGVAYVPIAIGVMIWTENRSAFAGLIAMITIISIQLAVRHRRRAMPVVLVAALLGVAALAWGIDQNMNKATPKPTTAGQRATENAAKTGYAPYWLLDAHRQTIWRFAFEHFLDHPWVGNGIDQLNRLPGADKPVAGLSKSAATVPSHPHNWLLEILAEAGLLGLLPMLGILAGLAWQHFRGYMARPNTTDVAALALMAGFWSSALFNFTIWAVWWQLTFLILYAMMRSRALTTR